VALYLENFRRLFFAYQTFMVYNQA